MRDFAFSTLAVVFLSIPAAAVDRVESSNEPCAYILKRINSQGDLVVRYPSTRPPGLILYDRYVEDLSQCSSDEELVRAAVPSRDGICDLRACRFDNHRH